MRRRRRIRKRESQRSQKRTYAEIRETEEAVFSKSGELNRTDLRIAEAREDWDDDEVEKLERRKKRLVAVVAEHEEFKKQEAEDKERGPIDYNGRYASGTRSRITCATPCCVISPKSTDPGDRRPPGEKCRKGSKCRKVSGSLEWASSSKDCDRKRGIKI